MKAFKICAAFLALLCIMTALASCSSAGKYDTSLTGKGEEIDMSKVQKEINSMSASDFETASGKTDYVLIKVKNYGDIVVVLREDVAPISVKNFKKLVSEGFYEGTVFHRVMKNFMIQGGGLDLAGKSKDADTIKGEFYANGVPNRLWHIRGVLSMARANDLNSGSSQFFIMHETRESLDMQYAAFGYVLAGMDVVDAIASCEVSGSVNSPAPVKPVIIESATFVQPK